MNVFREHLATAHQPDVLVLSTDTSLSSGPESGSPEETLPTADCLPVGEWIK